jgi:putative salt-induced outer membrane protein YdiY
MTRNFSAAIFLLFVQTIWADQVTLKNGDRFTGIIIKSDTKELLLKTDDAKDVTIKWDAIAAIAADGPVYVNTTDDQTLAGAVRTNDNQLIVTTKTAGTLAIPLANVRALRDQVEQTAYETQVERLRNPRIVDLWSGFLDFGYASAHGNANTQSFTLATRADRITTRDKITVFFNSIYASQSTIPPKQTTANSKIGGITYDVNIAKKWFVWGAVTLESDEFQQLNLRFVPSGGIGHHTINTETTKLDLRLGTAYNREFFYTFDRSSMEIVLGDDFTHNFSKTTVFQQNLRLFPNASNGAFRANFLATLSTEIKKWFALQVSFTDRYLSNPAPLHKTNDLIFSAGIRLSFGQPQ